MAIQLSNRVQSLGESATLAVTQRARQLKSEGHAVIAFGVGQPDFVTPAHIREAARKALDAGSTGYAIPASGILPAREAVCQRYAREFGVHYTPDRIIVTVGGKEAIYLAFLALLNADDEVVIPTPYWVSYPEQVALAQGRAVMLDGDPGHGFRITPQQLESALSPRTRIVVLNYPSNPGGFTYDRRDLEQLADVLRGRDITVLSDEMYDRLTYGGATHTCFASLSEDACARTLIVNAPSKSYAMTGWRMGYAAGPRELIAAMAKIQSQTTSGACHFNQYGMIEALTGDQTCVAEMQAVFDRRRRMMHAGLCAIDGVTCVEPQGAFYCFPDVSGTFPRLGVGGSVEFASRVLDEIHVAVVPGAAFGCDRHVRLAYAASDADIEEGLQRLQKMLG